MNRVLVRVDSAYTERYWKPKRKALSNSLQGTLIGTYREGSGFSFRNSRDLSVCYGQFHRSRFNDKGN